MEGLPQIVVILLAWLNQAATIAMGWFLSPAAWSQFALLAVAYLIARLITRRVMPTLSRLIDPGPRDSLFAAARRFVLKFLPLILPLTAYGLTAGGEEVTRSLFGSGEVIAFGKRVFLFIAARIFVRDVLKDGFLRLLGLYVLLPVAGLYTVGLLDDLTLRLDQTVVALGNIRFSVMSLIRGLIAGSLLFWLLTWSNRHSADYIKSQHELRPATRELALKAEGIEMPYPHRVIEIKGAKP